MGRIGILYGDVAKAADMLIAEGKNPTVDSVREELGSTGSKSTIAPLLKRWKAEHHQSVVTLDVGIPPALIDAVKVVFDNLQADVEQRIIDAQEAHQKELAEMAEVLQRQHEENAAAAEANLELSEEAARAQQVFEQLRAEQRALNLALATAQTENTGLQNRLTDRAAEIVTLHQQLGYARTQFEHYQEASTIQRTEERSGFEQRLMRMEQDLAVNRQQCSDQLLHISRQEVQLGLIPTLEQEILDMQETARAQHQQAALVTAEHANLSFKLQQLSTDRAELKNTLESTQKAFLDTRMQLAVKENATILLEKQFAQAEQKLERLLEEKSNLLQERAILQAQALASPSASPSHPA
ncbi:DNA-binding protein [Glaciimonas immobilis]|uniref:Chromosome segregation ATPase n=1 Tax=Glaciimonas immobilis TaxID=728004 RepID=A0A840RMN7_9BURK|nr:DNA-binding protein [Glaciimonas immobilis]KAF3999431.1 hypothetical protein HAV38_05795 [Glaciimonas immobilis]MBB5198935.1 chromosome segregation ATPase [Glaciimonas immobilis]